MWQSLDPETHSRNGTVVYGYCFRWIFFYLVAFLHPFWRKVRKSFRSLFQCFLLVIIWQHSAQSHTYNIFARYQLIDSILIRVVLHTFQTTKIIFGRFIVDSTHQFETDLCVSQQQAKTFRHIWMFWNWRISHCIFKIAILLEVLLTAVKYVYSSNEVFKLIFLTVLFKIF